MSESFPWAREPGVNRKQIRTFAELDFVAKHENLVLTGPTGVGKGLLAPDLANGITGVKGVQPRAQATTAAYRAFTASYFCCK
jgi:DNA replication protein DnaC